MSRREKAPILFSGELVRSIKLDPRLRDDLALGPDFFRDKRAELFWPSTQFITGQTLFVDGGKSLEGLGI